MRMSNAKGELQEMLQQRGLALPTYRIQSTGPPHSPTVVCTVTVRCGGRELCERVEARGKKKEVEKLAAGKMLQRLASPQTMKEDEPLPPSSARGRSSVSPVTGTVSPAAGDRRTSLSPAPATPLTYSPPPAPCAAQGTGRSPVSVLQEQLQAKSLSPPTYKEAVVSLSSSFAVRCVVCNSRQQPVLESQGEGPSKRTAKEAAARSMLRKMESATGVDRLPPISPLSGVASDIPDVVDHDLDDDITLALSPYSPQYHSWQTPGEVGVAIVNTHPIVPIPHVYATGVLSGMGGEWGRGKEGVPHHWPW